MLEHGGKLRAAARKYGIPEHEWLDLSTGINPEGYPVPALSSEAWRRLPDGDDTLRIAAARYYGSESLLPVAGSQAAIQALPRLRTTSRVGVLSPTYGEHAHAWRRAGHTVRELAAEAIEASLDALDVVVLANPNNPTGLRLARETLLGWRAHLVARGGWLVADEAFMDAAPEESLVVQSSEPGLIVLRSLGKFFGLAGARVGFVFADPDLLHALEEELGPWTVTGPAQAIAAKALSDDAWQEASRVRLAIASARLQRLLTEHRLAPSGGTALFQWIRTSQAAILHEQLARRGILARLFASPASLRFGLPGNELQWQRFTQALQEIGAHVAMETP